MRSETQPLNHVVPLLICLHRTMLKREVFGFYRHFGIKPTELEGTMIPHLISEATAQLATAPLPLSLDGTSEPFLTESSPRSAVPELVGVEGSLPPRWRVAYCWVEERVEVGRKVVERLD